MGNLSKDPYLNKGRDPKNNWGLVQSVSGGPYIWACCGRNQPHPGCWISKPSTAKEPIPYDFRPALDMKQIWRGFLGLSSTTLITKAADISPSWVLTQRGDAWLDQMYYDALHQRITKAKENITSEMIWSVMMTAYDRKIDDESWQVDFELNDTLVTNLRVIYQSQTIYNRPHCAEALGHPITKDVDLWANYLSRDFFALAYARKLMADPDNLNVVRLPDGTIVKLFRVRNQLTLEGKQEEIQRVNDALVDMDLQPLSAQMGLLIAFRQNPAYQAISAQVRRVSNLPSQLRQRREFRDYLSPRVRPLEAILNQEQNVVDQLATDIDVHANRQIRAMIRDPNVLYEGKTIDDIVGETRALLRDLRAQVVASENAQESVVRWLNALENFEDVDLSESPYLKTISKLAPKFTTPQQLLAGSEQLAENFQKQNIPNVIPALNVLKQAFRVYNDKLESIQQKQPKLQTELQIAKLAEDPKNTEIVSANAQKLQAEITELRVPDISRKFSRKWWIRVHSIHQNALIVLLDWVH
jgi:hypothetical protein